MAHFARVNNGIVEKVIVAEQEFIDSLEDAANWIQTSYNTYANQHPEGRPLRGNYAGIGYVYDSVNDVFYIPQPYPSWTLNKKTWQWESPIPMPNDGIPYLWNEETQSWVN